MAVEVRFWGVRGSSPCCSSEYQEVGGHTSCVSLYDGEDLLIFDAGTGLQDLGKWCLEKDIRRASLFISHTHFDHVIGLPFFEPLWGPDFRLSVYSSHFREKGGLKNFLKSHLLNAPFFPDIFEKCAGLDQALDIEVEVPTFVQGYEVSSIALNHPGGSCGYRVTRGSTICSYITDHESCEQSDFIKLKDFVMGSDLLIFDATFTKKEYAQKKGWGHSTWEHAVLLAKSADVKRLALFHHDPAHTDEIVSEVESISKLSFPETVAARQGMVIRI